MNWLQLQNKLLAAARRPAADDRVPYAFEKRVMARLAGPPARDEWASWVRALWCGAGACAAVTLALSLWAFPSSMDSDSSSFSEELEQTILAATDDLDGAWP